MVPDDPIVTVEVTPSDSETPEGVGESTALAAGEAHAIAEQAAAEANEALYQAEAASESAYATRDVVEGINVRVAALETAQTALISAQVTTQEQLSALIDVVSQQAALSLEDSKPDPEPVQPDSIPQQGGWLNKKIKW